MTVSMNRIAILRCGDLSQRFIARLIFPAGITFILQSVRGTEAKLASLKNASPLVLVMLVMQTGLAHSQDFPASQGLQQDLPADVTAYAIRRTGCNHWGGEEPYDAARKREIAAAIAKLRCQAIDRDEGTLRQRYLNVPQVQKAIDRASDG